MAGITNNDMWKKMREASAAQAAQQDNSTRQQQNNANAQAALQQQNNQQKIQQTATNGVSLPAGRTTGNTGTSSLTGINYSRRLEELGGGSYQASQNVQAANQYLQSILNAKPGAYKSNYTQQLNDLYNQIMNRDPFSYDINADALYQQYKDQFTLQGQNAMRDTMGQAAALTGGYGSSYASTAGNQAYQSYLQQLNEVVPELYAQAYQRYVQEGQDLKDKYGITQSADATDYGRYRDTVADWQADRGYAYGAYQDERNFDYNDYATQLNKAMQLLGMEQSDAQTMAQFTHDKEMLGLQQAYQDSVRQQGYDREDSLRADERAYNEQLLAAERAYEDKVRQDSYDYEDKVRNEGYAYQDKVRNEGYARDDQLIASEREYETGLRNEAYAREDQQMLKSYANDLAMQMIAAGTMPTADLLALAGISEADALALAKKNGYKAGGSSGGGSKSGSDNKQNNNTGNVNSLLSSAVAGAVGGTQPSTFGSTYEKLLKKALGV